MPVSVPVKVTNHAAPVVVKAMSPKLTAQTASIARVVVNPPPVTFTTNTLSGVFPFNAGLSNAFFSVSSAIDGTYLTIANFSPIPSNGLAISMQFISTNSTGFFKAGEH